MGDIDKPLFEPSVNQSDKGNEATPRPKSEKRWVPVVVYTGFVLFGQSGATLLTRLYYNEGGNTFFLSGLLETIGFPILIPFALYFSPKNLYINNNPTNDYQPSLLITSIVYLFLGLFQAASNVLYATGLQNLPVSTFSIISATELAFSAFFSFFLNAQKITRPILISLFLLTISSTLLIFKSNSDNSKESLKRRQLALGYSCTLLASALYALMMSMSQLASRKILGKENFRTVLNITIYQSFVETFVVLMALFASGDWYNLRNEMRSFGLGKGLYLVVTVMTAVAWQAFSVGAVGLIFEVSSLFSSVINTVGLPIMPILGAMFFHEKMDGMKVISIFLAIGGFASYVYQHYPDDSNTREGYEILLESDSNHPSSSAPSSEPTEPSPEAEVL
ncbi:hypothetical protein BUALT_Bualt12G0133700 [Buddleja alternifolia]|uniref:Probable purine permease n=1 Tax=Buddleja alternifolia TaxID=168488 RepID=A0AAV6WZF8_9LAMI|nr:hypothetical protein BUALT_Bualt12G0133700 [Buddleja alternifolia]